MLASPSSEAPVANVCAHDHTPGYHAHTHTLTDNASLKIVCFPFHSRDTALPVTPVRKWHSTVPTEAASRRTLTHDCPSAAVLSAQGQTAPPVALPSPLSHGVTAGRTEHTIPI